MTISVKSRPFRYSHSVGRLALTGKGFSNPIDLALGKGELLYVLNRSNATQAPQGAVRVTICTVGEEYIGEFGGFGTDDGQIVWPTAIAVDLHGNIYVSDEHRHDVQVFGPDHAFIRKWGSQGSGDGQLDRPSGLAVDADDNVFVVDHMNNRICKFTPEGELLTTWGRAGSGPGEFNLPWGVGVDKQGQVYVADWRNDRIQKFTGDGDYLATIGEPGSEVGQLRRPANMAVDDDGNIYVADWGNERVAVFTPLGFPLTMMIGDSEMSTWGAEFLAANPDLVEGRKIMADGTPEKRIHGPTAVEVDAEGRVIIVDSCRHRLQIYERA
ncbi:MAG: NHL repeat-containing protein [Chloroflexota bacterium]|nr:NHL repeat-containing protein [Chloroflexota bacterium]